MSSVSGNILELKNVKVVYDNVILALHDVSLKVPKGKVVALLGANGAGKSTTLKAVSTMLASERGKVTKGTIEYDGTSIEKQNPGGGLKSYFFKPSPFITLPSCLTLLEAFGSNTGMISHAPQSLIESNMIWTSSYLYDSITKKIR